MDTTSVLNLDELFGQTKPIKVRWQGVEYELRRPENLGPVEIARNEKLGKRHETLTKRVGERGFANNEAAQTELGKVLNELISILCPELAKAKLPFAAQLKVLDFYDAEVIATSPKQKMPTVMPVSSTGVTTTQP